MQTSATKSLGLVVGLGPAAGIYYYRHLVRALNTLPVRPELILAHADVGTARSLAAEKPADLAEYIARFLIVLAKAGCDVAAISATTPHLCLSELTSLSPIPIVSLLDAARDGVLERGMQRVAIFGTRQTIESDLFGALTGVDVVRPRPSEIAGIATIYGRAVDRFGATQDDLAELAVIANELFRREAIEAVVVAGTDLSEALDAHPPNYPHVDVSKLHLDAIYDSICSAPLLTKDS
jgi:aspartate racemase